MISGKIRVWIVERVIVKVIKLIYFEVERNDLSMFVINMGSI